MKLDFRRGTHASDVVARAMQDQGYDVYFGVLPRVRKSGTADDVEPKTDLLWADIDAKKQETRDLAGCYESLAGVMVSPQVLVDSGGGLHAYWLLDRSIEWGYAESLMRGIARAVNGDAVYDRPRVLRLPGTVNQKYEHKPEARVLRFDLVKTYRPGDFDDLVVIERPARQSDHTYERNDELPEWLLDLIKNGAPQGQRSETCFKVILWLVRYGRTDEEIEMIFESTPTGIGEKYHEKGRDGARWLRLTTRQARAAA